MGGLPVASVVVCTVTFAAYTTIHSVTFPHTSRTVFQTLWIRIMTRRRVRTKAVRVSQELAG